MRYDLGRGKKVDEKELLLKRKMRWTKEELKLVWQLYGRTDISRRELGRVLHCHPETLTHVYNFMDKTFREWKVREGAETENNFSALASLYEHSRKRRSRRNE